MIKGVMTTRRGKIAMADDANECLGDYVSKKDFNDFRIDQKREHKGINDQLKKLEPLAELIPEIKNIVETQKTVQRGSKWVMGFLGFVALVMAIGYNIYKIFTGK